MSKILKTRRIRLFSVALSSVAFLGATLVAAQPAHAQRQDRRNRMQNMTPEQRVQAFQQMMQNMTPEQQQRMMERAGQWLQTMTPDQQQQILQSLPPEMQQRAKALIAQQKTGGGTAVSAADLAKWNWIRRALTTAGYTDATLQDAVVAFMQAQEKAHVPLQEKARALATVLVKPDTPEAQLTTELASFRKAVADDRTRYNTELAALDKKISFSKQPRLESLLSVLGAVGYEVPEIGGLNAVYPNTGTTATRNGGAATGRGNRTGRGGRNGAGGTAAGGNTAATGNTAAGNAVAAGNTATAGNTVAGNPGGVGNAAPVVPAA